MVIYGVMVGIDLLYYEDDGRVGIELVVLMVGFVVWVEVGYWVDRGDEGEYYLGGGVWYVFLDIGVWFGWCEEVGIEDFVCCGS